MSASRLTTRPPFCRQGFTLVEVLVAIIILLIGVAAAMRIFPRGFDIFTRTEQVSAGMDEVKALIAELAAHPDGLPEAVLPVSLPDGSQPLWENLNSFAWDDLSATNIDVKASIDPNEYPYPNFAFPTGADLQWPLWEPLSARVLRHVIGERCVIPSDFTTTDETAGIRVSGVPKYLPRFGPLEADRPIAIYDLRYRKVGAGELQELAGKPGSLRDQLYYAIDYATGTVSLPDAGWHKIHAVYYSVGAAGDAPVQCQEDFTNAGGTKTLVLSNGPVVPGSEKLNRAYEQVTAIAPGDWAAIANLQSGQFYIADDPQGSLLLGAIFFAKADAGHTVKVDYTVADWNILHEDVTVDGEGFLQLALAPKMRSRGGTREPATWGLYGPMDNDSVVMALVNAISGIIYQVRVDNPNLRKPNYRITLTIGASNSAGSPVLQFASLPPKIARGHQLYLASEPDVIYTVTNVDPVAQQILLDRPVPDAHTSGQWQYVPFVLTRDETLSTRWRIEMPNDWSAGIALKGQTFRVFYRATQDWTVQFFRPPAVFWCKESQAGAIDDLKDADLGWDSFSYATLGGKGWIALPAVYGRNAGKGKVNYGGLIDKGMASRGQSVAVDYQWEDASTGESKLVRVTGEVHTVPPADAGRRATVITLRHPRAEGTAITVRGVSVTVRALWVQPRRGPATFFAASSDPAKRTSSRMINERWEAVDSTVILPSSEE